LYVNIGHNIRHFALTIKIIFTCCLMNLIPTEMRETKAVEVSVVRIEYKQGYLCREEKQADRKKG